MTPERYALAQRIFLDACDRDAADRAAFLDEACGHDAELRCEVEALLADRTEDDGDDGDEPDDGLENHPSLQGLSRKQRRKMLKHLRQQQRR